jgi:apolipoprotein D and lipocalin family protein
VRDATHAVCMQFIWPIKAGYRIAYLDAAYNETIIARSARDYAWIMARTPTLSPQEYRRLVAREEILGYDVEPLRAVAQRCP